MLRHAQHERNFSNDFNSTPFALSPSTSLRTGSVEGPKKGFFSNLLLHQNSRGGSPVIERVKFKLNGKPLELDVDGERKLLWVLRADLGLTGTKYGCGEGLCGACTVLIDRKANRSCQIPVKEIRGKEVTTIEGLEEGGHLHSLQQSFIDHGALQCGFCTPGMILNAYSLLLENPRPTEAEIIQAMDDNLCRCGAHVRIIQAIQSAAKEMAGGKK